MRLPEFSRYAGREPQERRARVERSAFVERTLRHRAQAGEALHRHPYGGRHAASRHRGRAVQLPIHDQHVHARRAGRTDREGFDPA